MTVFRASGLAVAAALTLGGALSAWAQAPIQLRPKVEQKAPKEQPSAPSGIKVEPLKAPDVDAVGVLGETEGGFGADMWSGSSRALVAKLLPSLPAASGSRTMRAMMRRLLLSTAAVPDGPAPKGVSLLAQRVERLWAMGEPDAMLALIDAAPHGPETRPLLRQRIDGLLLKGDSAAACADLPAARAAADADLYLAQVEAFCHALAGRTAEAALTATWLRDRGHVDSAFQALLEALLGEPVPDLDSLRQPTPLHLAMLKAAKRPIPADAAESSAPAVLRAVALAVNAPPETRLAAAEKAEWLGALDTETLRQLYAGMTFRQEEAERSIEDAGEDRGGRSRALLFRAAQMQKTPSARAEIVAKAFALARRHGHFESAARLYAPLIEELKPTPDLAFFAGDALRGLLAAGRSFKAKPWLPLAERAPRDPVWPLIRLLEAGDDDGVPPAKLLAWLAQRRPLAADRAGRQGAVLFGLLDALGDKVGTEGWLALMEGPPLQPAPALPTAALWHALRLAAEDLRLAETVLLALISLGPDGPGGTEPTSLYRVIAALRLVGFDDEARSLAVEAALANGV